MQLPVHAPTHSQPMPGAPGGSWLYHAHPEHAARADRWVYVDDVYSGRYADPGKIASYLPMRPQGESAEAYAWRCTLADPDLLFAALINSLAGQVFAVEDDIVRVFQPETTAEGLGSEEDRDSIAGRLWRDFDGQGTNYPVFWRRQTVDLLRFQRMWFLAEGVQRDKDGNVTAEPSTRAIKPERVMDWHHDADGRLVEVKVKHDVMKPRDGVKAKPETETQYTVYGLDGWTRYRVKTDAAGRSGEPAEEEVDHGAYEWYDSAEDRHRARRCLPIWPVDLALDQDVGYLLARKAVAAFNMESGRDALINTGNTPRLVDESADEQADAHLEEIEEGGNYHQTVPGEKMYYIAPSMDAAEVATRVLEAKWKNLFVSGYQRYADEARQKTATEVRQDRAEGVEAFLGFLSVAVDEAENRALFMMEQAEFPKRPELWGQAYVERSTDFAPVDAAAEADRMAERVFPDAPPPIGETGRKGVAERWARAHAVEVDEAEIEAEVQGQAEAARAAREQAQNANAADRRALDIEARRREIEEARDSGGNA